MYDDNVHNNSVYSNLNFNNSFSKKTMVAFMAPRKITDLFNRKFLLISASFLTMMAMATHLTAQQLYDYQIGTTSGRNVGNNYNYNQNYDSKSWSTIIGASISLKPVYEGDNSYGVNIAPVLSIGQYGFGPRFISHNDNMSFSFIETRSFRLGLNGKILGKRDSDQSDLNGLKSVKLGGEIGGFVEIYPVDGVRLRGELRHGLRTHNAITADLNMDVFRDISQTMQISMGPRAFFATKDYFDTYYGVDAVASDRSHLPQFSGNTGFGSVGFGGAISWKTTDKITTNLFGEYSRLMGSAADSSLVNLRGSKNQLSVGISAYYRFDSNNP